MYLAKCPRSNGRIFLSIVHGFRDENGKVKKRTIKQIGYLDELENEYPDPVTHFTEVAAQMEKERQESLLTFDFRIKSTDKLNVGDDLIKNFGYAGLNKIYHELELNKFLINRQKHCNFEYDSNTIMKLLVFMRIIRPASKKATYENRNLFFEKDNYSLDDIYRCLTFLNSKKEDMVLWMHNHIVENYKRDTSIIYYDVTNYYFETDDQDGFRMKGVSKEKRKNPIVQMGLFIDNNGIPITYDLFPGNLNDSLTYRPNLGTLKKHFNMGRVITVADKGIITGDNIWYTIHTPSNDGYVFSLSVSGSEKEIKDYILDAKGYRHTGKGFKIKSKLSPRNIYVTQANGKKKTVAVDEKMIVFYSEKYAARAKEERKAALLKAEDLKNNPCKYTRATSYGAAKYIRKIEFSKDTGEIITARSNLLIDTEKIKEEEKYDGYYILVTSEIDRPDEEIIGIYRGLWKIEESFKVTKSDIEGRPAFVSTEDHIRAHFLTCFVALTIMRILEMKLKSKYCCSSIIESLRKSTCTNIDQNIFIFNYYDEILKELGEELKIDFDTKARTLHDIKKILSDTKKNEKGNNFQTNLKCP